MTLPRPRRKLYPYHKRPEASGMLGRILEAFDELDHPVIGYADNLGGYTPWPKVSRNYYRVAIHRMKKKGWVEEAHKQGKKFLKLTKKGKTQLLLYKLKRCTPGRCAKWNGKWWLAIFDIPEQGRKERDHIRLCLKQAGFQRLQKSVYIYPQEVPQEAVDYLNESGLAQFIRFLRVDQFDGAQEFKRRFRL